MNKQEIFDTYSECIMPTYTKVPLIFVKGKGSYLWDIHNRKYLDFFPGWGVGNVGHCNPDVVSGIRDQVSKLIFVPNNYFHAQQARLAREVIHWSFPAKVFFCNSGAEANEAAIKLARRFGRGRYEIITFEKSFHGRTLANIAACGQKKYQEGFEPLPEGFKTVAFNDIQAVEKAAGDKTVAVMLELIQGEGGINVAGREFVNAVRRICDEKKLLMIVDEVQTGIGRTGKMFCFQHYGIVPDVVTLAKSLGGGLPIGMMLAKKEIADTLPPGSHASTFGGGPLVCKAALGVFKAIDKGKLLNNAGKQGDYLKQGLLQLKEKHQIIQDVRGIGLMLGVELKIKGNKIVELCRDNGLLINCTQENVLRIMPALGVGEKEIDKALGILDRALKI
ncbi:MAG: aspartate aminotransferase family protein [Candidatus Omnitrophica bacterium]|nr:aspartate aminotransferase family protein [Candidatus Omnitrophota bacterium]